MYTLWSSHIWAHPTQVFCPVQATKLLSPRSCLQICVYPNQIPVPLMENSGLPTPPVGMLELTVQRCSNLRSKDLVGAGDPYVKTSVLTMGTAKDKHGKEVDIVAKEEPPHYTAVKSKKNPEFNEHFKVLLFASTRCNVSVGCFWILLLPWNCLSLLLKTCDYSLAHKARREQSECLLMSLCCHRD